jgi:hypothetical protein
MKKRIERSSFECRGWSGVLGDPMTQHTLASFFDLPTSDSRCRFVLSAVAMVLIPSQSEQPQIVWLWTDDELPISGT